MGSPGQPGGEDVSPHCVPGTADHSSHCTQLTAVSTGGAGHHQQDSLGRYSVAGDMWEGSVPYWENGNNLFLAPTQAEGGIMWLVGSSTGGYNLTLASEEVVEGLDTCPHLVESWVYEWGGSWYRDDTLHFVCINNGDQD